jgi:hypothetical protein
LKVDFSLETICTYEQVQELINQFEPDIELKTKGQLGLNGLYYLLFCFSFESLYFMSQ